MEKLIVIELSAFCRMPRALFLLLKVKTSCFFCGSVVANCWPTKSLGKA